MTSAGCEGLARAAAGSIFGIYDPNEECSLEDMDDPEQMMKNCVINVCQPGAPPLNPKPPLAAPAVSVTATSRPHLPSSHPRLPCRRGALPCTPP